MSVQQKHSDPERRGTQPLGGGQKFGIGDSSSYAGDEIDMLRNAAEDLIINGSKPQICRGTGLVYDEVMTNHKCEWDTHFPENPHRIIETFRRIHELGLVERCHRMPLYYATEDQVMEGHSRALLDLAQSLTKMDMQQLQGISSKYDSWYANQATYKAALASSGSTLTLVDHILRDKVTNGFALIRPPGHHAMPDEFNGYCTFNNVALAAKNALLRGVNRILIVDWDVHHGQGVQRMFYDNPRVLYFSIHRYEHGEYWPNLRESDYDFIGQEEGQGFNVNVPLNETGMTNSDYMAILHQLLLPLAYEFAPDLLLVCNGLDAAIGDEKGEMLLTPAMYAHMTHYLMMLGAGRVALVLEGGYCIESLSESCALSLRSLLGDPCPVLPATEEPSNSVCISILNVIKALKPYWECFNYYKSLLGDQLPAFDGIMEWPPKVSANFSSSEKRPDIFPIYGNYPQRSKEVTQHYVNLIDQLVAETNLQKAQNKCCYVFDADMRAHKNLFSRGHPERPDRISCIYNKMCGWNLLKRCLNIPSRLAQMSEILWIHRQEYVEGLNQTQNMSNNELEVFPTEKNYPSIYINQKTIHCALLSCGSLLNVTDAVLRGQAQSGLAIIRPPGHHAECNRAMGFCFFNNVAIAAKFAQTKYDVQR